MFRLYEDPFTQYLRAKGTEVKVYQPGGFLGLPAVGWRIRVGNSYVVYRIPEETPEILLIVLFEREGKRNGLLSPFADLTRFVRMVKHCGLPIHYIKGLVDIVSGRPADHLDPERIAAFYTRYLGGRRVPGEDGDEWVLGDVRVCETPLAAQRREEAAPPQEGAPA